MADPYPVGLLNNTFACLVDNGVITEHPNLPLPLYNDPNAIANLVDEQKDVQPIVKFEEWWSKMTGGIEDYSHWNPDLEGGHQEAGETVVEGLKLTTRHMEKSTSL